MIREARYEDVDGVLALLARAGGRPGIRDTSDRLRHVIDADHAWLLVWHESNVVAGCVIAAWDGWRGTIYRLGVAPEFRRRGIATALVRAGEQRLERAGARRIGLMVFKDNEAAHAFWRECGYELDTRVDRFVRNVGDRR